MSDEQREKKTTGTWLRFKKKKNDKNSSKNKISTNYNLAHFVLKRNVFSPKIYTAVSDHDTFYRNVCLHLTSTPREANESLMSNINFLLTISIHQQEKSYENHQNDHQRENALIFYQFLLTNSLRKYTEIGLENMSVDIGVKGSKVSCAGFLLRDDSGQFIPSTFFSPRVTT